MAKFAVMASELKSLKKSIEDRKLAELKKEIIEILKKQDEKDFKKAIDYFESQELHFTHLEKSLSGKWIQKAGYGIGTVRIWKGKKYKKIALGKWARVFDKEGRGANVSIGRLIAEVDKIQTIEKLYEFAMAHKQRFVDDNGIDLPILDKLRAKVDSKNNELSNGGMGSKGTSKPAEKKKDENVEKFPGKTLESKKKQLEKLKSRLSDLESKDVELTTRSQGNWGDGMRLSKLPSSKEWENNREKIEGVKAKIEILKREIRDEEEKPYWIQDIKGNRLTNEDAKEKIKVNLKKIDELSKGNEARKDIKIRDMKNENDYLMERLNQNDKRDMEIEAKFYESEESEAEKKEDDSKAYEGKLATQKQVDYATEVSDKYSLTREEMLKKPITAIQKYANSTVEDFEGGIDKFIEYMAEGRSEGVSMDEVGKEFAKLINHNVARKIWDDYESGALIPDEKGILKTKESETEKTQNRSEAMKGNQNAKKYGLTDEQIERYDIQEVVEDMNGYGIVKNSEGKYSYIDDGRVKDRPDDFEISIEKVKERINDTYETKKNIQAATDYDFKNAKLGSDIEYSKRSDGRHMYFKKSPDGSKAISVTVEVSDMREPLNMTYEVSDTKTGESWQYETAYGNKEGLEWAVERPEQMEKELKKFFKRDPKKEWDKQNGDYKPQNDVYAPSESADMEKKKAIAENKNIGENEVQMPYSKELAAEMESLKNCVSRDPVREFMQRVYYENGNLVATDGRRIKVVKVGNLNGIDNGTYVDIDITKNGINIKENDFEGQFPKYDKVIPDDLSQKVTLNNKVIKDKIKEMKKDGAIDKKVGRVQLEFKDDKVYLDDTEIGEAKNINLKYSDDWGPAREETNIINVNADYLVNALNGNSSTLMLGERADKAMGISTDSTTNIIMPMVGSHEKMDYSAGRSEKAAEKEKKAAELKRNKEYNQELCKVFESKYGYDLVENMASHIDERLPGFSNEDLQREYNRLGLNYDKLMEKKAISINSVVDKKSNMDLKKVYLYQKVMEKHPEVKDKIIAELEKRGISVKKSLFDDFIMDVFEADDEEEIEDAIKADETEYNDYSAEQPELFNSTSMKVREALDRIRNQVL